MDAETVQEIAGLAGPKVVTVNGREYSSATLVNPPLPTEPEFPEVSLHSLDSLMDFIGQQAPSFLKDNECFVLCQSQGVYLQTKPLGENRRRDTLAYVGAGAGSFAFGQYAALEDMRLGLLTNFVDTPSRQEVLLFLSKVTDQQVATSEDDGVSQTVTAKSGIASYGKATVPSPVTLQPIRTFAEVEQPAGKFVLRLKQQEKGLPQAGLFELHTNWQRQAALNVKAYLESKNCPVPVFA